MDGLVKKTMPAYFRSQRQIIIDAEALLRTETQARCRRVSSSAPTPSASTSGSCACATASSSARKPKARRRCRPTTCRPTTPTTTDTMRTTQRHAAAQADALTTTTNTHPRLARQRRSSAKPAPSSPSTATSTTSPKPRPCSIPRPRRLLQRRARPDVAIRAASAPGQSGRSVAVRVQGARLHQAGAAGRPHLSRARRQRIAADRREPAPRRRSHRTRRSRRRAGRGHAARSGSRRGMARLAGHAAGGSRGARLRRPHALGAREQHTRLRSAGAVRRDRCRASRSVLQRPVANACAKRCGRCCRDHRLRSGNASAPTATARPISMRSGARARDDAGIRHRLRTRLCRGRGQRADVVAPASRRRRRQAARVACRGAAAGAGRECGIALLRAVPAFRAQRGRHAGGADRRSGPRRTDRLAARCASGRDAGSAHVRPMPNAHPTWPPRCAVIPRRRASA